MKLSIPSFADLAVEPPARRQCHACGEEKETAKASWPQSHGKPNGRVCLLCSRAYHKKYKHESRRLLKEARAAGTSTLMVPPELARTALTPVPAHKGSDPRTTVPGELTLKQLNTAVALREGASVLNANASALVATALGYAMDRTSVHHEWTLRHFLERIMPVKMYAELGLSTAGVASASGERRPSVTINVLPATAPNAEGRVVDVVLVDEERSE